MSSTMTIRATTPNGRQAVLTWNPTHSDVKPAVAERGMRLWLCYLAASRAPNDGMMPRQRAARYTRVPLPHNDNNHRRHSVMPFTTAATGAREHRAAR